MSEKYGRCRTCGSYDFLLKHECPPSWAVHCEEYDLKENVYAFFAREAAEKFVADLERRTVHFPVGSGEKELEVTVTSSEGNMKKFLVTGSVEPAYDAREII